MRACVVVVEVCGAAAAVFKSSAMCAATASLRASIWLVVVDSTTMAAAANCGASQTTTAAALIWRGRCAPQTSRRRAVLERASLEWARSLARSLAVETTPAATATTTHKVAHSMHSDGLTVARRRTAAVDVHSLRRVVCCARAKHSHSAMEKEEEECCAQGT